MANEIFGNVGGIAAQVGGIVIIFVAAAIIIAVMVGILFAVRKNKFYNRDQIIFRRKQGGGLTGEFDKGGYFKNKNQDWKFKLKRAGVWLTGDYKYDLPKEHGGNINFLFRDTADNFYHLEPVLEDKEAKFVLDEKGEKIPVLDKWGKPLINEDGSTKYVKHAKVRLKVTSEDVEWAKQEFTEHTLTYTKKDMLTQLAPIIGTAIFVVLVIVMMYLLLQKFEVLNSVAAGLKEVSKNLLTLKQSGIPSAAPV